MRKKPDLSTVDRFIQGAGAQSDAGLPWAGADERITRGFNLRLTEPMLLKLQFIKEHTPFSIQAFIMAALEPAVEEKINELLGRK